MGDKLVRNGLVVGIIFLFVASNVVSGLNIQLKNTTSPLITNRGSTLYVGGIGEGNYTKIQDAIDNTTDGDTIFVFDDSSPYYENITITNSICLIGENKNTTIIDGNKSEIIVYISADDVKISEFTIYNSRPGGMLYDFFGILFFECSNYEVSNNKFLRTDVGIGSYLGDNGSIIKNYFDGKIYSDSDGIVLYGSSDTLVCNNYLTEHSGHAIRLSGNPKSPENITIIKNVLTNNFEAIFGGAKNSVILSNYLYNNPAGIYVGGNYLKIINNTVINTKFVITNPMRVSIFFGICSSSNYQNISYNYIYNYFQGIELDGAEYNIISYNQVTNCKCGIQIRDSRNNQIFRNNITKNNGYPAHMYYPDFSGLILYENAYNNYIYQNNFIQNLFQATFMGAPDNNWNENYWNRPMNNPKRIIGRKETYIFFLPVYIFPEFNYDWHPAQEPYDIPTPSNIKGCGII